MERWLRVVRPLSRPLRSRRTADGLEGGHHGLPSAVVDTLHTSRRRVERQEEPIASGESIGVSEGSRSGLVFVDADIARRERVGCQRSIDRDDRP